MLKQTKEVLVVTILFIVGFYKEQSNDWMVMCMSTKKESRGKRSTKLDSPWLKRLTTAPCLIPLERRRVEEEATREMFISFFFLVVGL